MNGNRIKKYLPYLLLLADLFLLNRINDSKADVFLTVFMLLYAAVREQVLRYSRKKALRLAFVVPDLLVILISSWKLIGPWLRLVARRQFVQIGTYWAYIEIEDLKSLLISALKMLCITLALMPEKKGKNSAFKLLSFLIFVFADLTGPAKTVIMEAWFLLFLSCLCLERMDLTKKRNIAVILVTLTVCSWLAGFLEPSIAAIKNPESDKQGDSEFGIFDSPSTKYDYTQNVARKLGVIDKLMGAQMRENQNPLHADALVEVRSSAPFKYIKAYSAGDYNYSQGRFELEDEDGNKEGGTYYANAIFGAEEDVRISLKERMVVYDYSDSLTLFMPYTSFAIYHDQVGCYKDRYLYFGIGEKRQAYSFYFSPDTVYAYYDIEYLEYANSRYLQIPEEMRPVLENFIRENGLNTGKDVKDTIYKVHSFLIENMHYADKDPQADIDPVLDFLTVSLRGTTKRFAAAEVLLLRALGIPARYTYGFRLTHWKDNVAYAAEEDGIANCEVLFDNKWQFAEELVYNWKNERLHFGPDPEVVVEVTEKPEEILPQEEKEGAILQLATPVISRKPIDRMENKTELRVICTERLELLRAYSCGDYDTRTASFLREENIASLLEEAGISSLEKSYEAYVFTDAAEKTETLKVENVHASGYIYTPYWPVVQDGWKLYQDKYVTTEDTELLNAYALQYSMIDQSLENDPAYAAYCRKHYVTIDESLRNVLTDFLLSQHIDPLSKDKNTIINQIRELFKDQYIYTLDMRTIPEDKDPVLYFLTESKVGYCQHFAAAMTLLLRTCEIPARYTVGYLGPFVTAKVNEVTNLQAHSWVEVFTEEGWKPLEASLGRDEQNDIRIFNTDKEAQFVFPEEEKKERSLILTCVIGVLALVALLAYKPLKALFEKLRPTLQQKINGSYLLLKKHHYINEEIESMMLRIRYSPQRESEDDENTIRLRRKTVKNIYLLTHRYLHWILFCFGEIMIVLQAFWENLTALVWPKNAGIRQTEKREV